jgi:hypothetical protein
MGPGVLESEIGRATGKIQDAATGAQAKQRDIAAMGGPAFDPRFVQEAADRRKSGAATDLTIDREHQNDAIAGQLEGMNQGWEQMMTGLLGSAGNLAGNVAGNQLSQGGLALNLANASNSAAQSQMQMLMQLFQSLSAGGGGSTGGGNPFAYLA